MTAPASSPGLCPRCSGPLVVDLHDEPGVSAFTGDLDTEVCMSCCADEAVRFAYANEVVPQHEWPIREGAHDHLHTYDALNEDLSPPEPHPTTPPPGGGLRGEEL